MAEQYSYQNRSSQRRRRGCGCGTIALISLILIIILVVVAFTTGIGANLLHTGSIALKVSDHPTLIISDDKYVEKYSPIPSIVIHTSKENESITISAAGRQIFSDPITYQQTKNGDVTLVSIDTQYAGQVDITVPSNTNLKIDTNSATIDVNQVVGQMVLQSNSGIITVKDSFVNGNSLIVNNNGSIQLQNTKLMNGHVSIENNTGSISFDGFVQNQANSQYLFKESQGTLSLGLPTNSAFHLEAATVNGTLTSTFPGITGQSKSISQNVGTSPTSHLILSSINGAINIHQGKGV